MTIKEFIKKEPISLLGRAYRFSEKAHSTQKRKTGEPYFVHVLATAETLSLWRLDETAIAAGLLHDVVEDTEVSIEDIRKEFGDEIAFLVDGVTKLGKIKYRGIESRVENLRKMILALSMDLRVIFIKLADRLHNMKTLSALPPQKQKRIALETDEIYAPIAYRLGMQNLSGELHDLAFPYLHPEEDRWIKRTVPDEYNTRINYLKKTKPILEKAFEENGLRTIEIDFRAKRHSSLYKKMLRRDMDIGKIYDLVAMRIVVETVSECYAALGIIHQIWPPLPGRIKDYIAMPKPNGYRSLHTTVIGPDGKFIEIQIRTQDMHQANENGIAAHWLYAQDKTGKLFKKPQSQILEETKWVEQLRAWQERMHGEVNSEEFMQSMKIDFFKDRIFAITPKGDAIDLPAGATPVDFAYQVHSEIGNSCVGARVNDQIVPLSHELRSGDVVQILTQKNKKPSEDWLKFVKTSIARDHIRIALRKSIGGLVKRGPTKTELKMVLKDRIGLLKDILGIISRSHLNVLAMTTVLQPGSSYPVSRMELGTIDKNKIEKLIMKLKNIKDIKEVSYQLI